MSKIIMLGTALAGALLSFSVSASDWVTSDLCSSVLKVDPFTENRVLIQTVEDTYFSFLLKKDKYRDYKLPDESVIDIVVNGKKLEVNLRYNQGDAVTFTSYHKDIPLSRIKKQISFIQSELKSKNELVIVHTWGTTALSAKGFSKAWKGYLDCQL